MWPRLGWESEFAGSKSSHFGLDRIIDLYVLPGPGRAGTQRGIHHRRPGELERIFGSIPGGAHQKAVILYFSPSYRPLGGLFFYRPLFSLAGFQPLPYRVLCFVLLVGNLGLLFLAIRSITGSSEIAAISTLIGAFHPRLVDLYWNNGAIYDILCFTFYFGALTYYVRARRTGPLLNLRQTAAFLALYVSALDSKEMAVTLPVVLILYELIYFPLAGFSAPQIGKWALTNCRLAAIAGAMTAPYVWAKLLAQSPFSQLSSYHLEITLGQFLATYGAYLDALFYRDRWFGVTQTAVLLAGMLGIALLRQSRHLTFAWSIAVAGVLPIAFIPVRTAYVLYIPLAGWSWYVATLLVFLRDVAVSAVKSIGGAKVRQVALFVLVLLLLLRAYRVQRLRMYGQLTLGQPVIRSVLGELDRLHPKLSRGTRLLAVNDPLPHPYELLLLLRLYFRDNTLEVDHSGTDDGRHTNVLVWCGTTLYFLNPTLPGAQPCPN
jgi:hypothetical protein